MTHGRSGQSAPEPVIVKYQRRIVSFDPQNLARQSTFGKVPACAVRHSEVHNPILQYRCRSQVSISAQTFKSVMERQIRPCPHRLSISIES